MCIQSQTLLSSASHISETPISSSQFPLESVLLPTLQATEAGEAEGYSQDPTGT